MSRELNGAGVCPMNVLNYHRHGRPASRCAYDGGDQFEEPASLCFLIERASDLVIAEPNRNDRVQNRRYRGKVGNETCDGVCDSFRAAVRRLILVNLKEF